MGAIGRYVDGTLLTLVGVLVLLCLLAWWRGGTELLSEGLGNGGRLLLRFSLLLVVSFLIAGLAENLIPETWVKSALGEDSGFRGLLLATAAGVITPAGPFVSMPIAATMLRSGAALPAVVAFLSSWSLLAAHRFFAWEIPILGFRTAAVRYAVCLVLPLIAGGLTRLLLRG